MPQKAPNISGLDIAGQSIYCERTDGVWEAHNSTGDMFGKDALHEVIRRNSDSAAIDIVNAVVAAVKQFQGGIGPEDDITMVVVKMTL